MLGAVLLSVLAALGYIFLAIFITLAALAFWALVAYLVIKIFGLDF